MMARMQQGGGAQVAATQSEETRRRRSAEAMAEALQPLRAELSAEQQSLLDEELTLMANSRRANVWVLRDGAATQVPVRIGLADNSHSEVLTGLQPGDEVITGIERTP
jgi:HlyD family secretion protein